MKFFKKIDELDKNPSIKEKIDRECQEIYIQSKNEIKEMFDQASREDNNKFIDTLWSNTREMINHIDARIHYWEERRTQFLQITLAVLAVSVVAFTTLSPNLPLSEYFSDVRTIFTFPVFLSSIVLFVGSINLLLIWNKQNNPNYPFTKSFNVWRWQYRDAEKHPINTEVNKYTEKTFKKEAKSFAANLTNYKQKTINSSEIDLFDQDLSQLYLLITNEKFKIKFVNKLRDSLLYSLKFSVWLFIAGFVGTLILCLYMRFSSITNLE